MNKEQSILQIAANKWWETRTERDKEILVDYHVGLGTINFDGNSYTTIPDAAILKIYSAEHPGKSEQQFSKEITADVMNEQYLKLKDHVKVLREALEYCLTRIENSDSWWMDSEDKGGFNTDKIQSALEQTK